MALRAEFHLVKGRQTYKYGTQVITLLRENVWTVCLELLLHLWPGHPNPQNKLTLEGCLGSQRVLMWENSYSIGAT